MPELINRKVCREWMESVASNTNSKMPQLSERFWAGLNVHLRRKLTKIINNSYHKRLTDEDVWE